ncbi:MAG TPA: DUF362 domain-containing protein [Anaerolineaceae bacterium]
MTSLSRREFIRRVAASAGGLTGAYLLQACGQAITPAPTQVPAATLPPSPAHTATVFQSMTRAAATTGAPTAASAAPAAIPSATPGIADLAVARGGEPEDLVKRALAALGGIERFVKSGNTVVIKPNICTGYHSYDYAATTNPWVVAALVKLCLGAGAAKVSVMDYPFGSTAQVAYKISGIQKEVEAAGGVMAFMPGYKYKSVMLPNSKSLKKAEVFEDILNADVLIDVPVAKNHDSAILTLGMKNLMGVVKDREDMHVSLQTRIADLANFIRPKLTVIDAVRIMVAGGPTGGNLDNVKKLDTIIASADVVAADAYAATLFGLKATDIPHIMFGAVLGLGKADLSGLKIEEIPVAG